tara:strand:+ start:730 stop:1107 length:378 start_codon:yes stop_codon:yes gene_type:complete
VGCTKQKERCTVLVQDFGVISTNSNPLEIKHNEYTKKVSSNKTGNGVNLTILRQLLKAHNKKLLSTRIFKWDSTRKKSVAIYQNFGVENAFGIFTHKKKLNGMARSIVIQLICRKILSIKKIQVE